MIVRMKYFKHASIKQKQTLIVLVTTGVALLLVCTAFAIFEMVTFREEMAQNLSTLAKVVGDNTSAAVDFDDTRSAEETLATLRAKPEIIGACIYGKNGNIFAQYSRSSGAAAFSPPHKYQTNGYAFTKGKLVLFQPIVSKTDTVGVIYLESNIHALYSRLSLFGMIVAVVFSVTLLVTFLLSSRMQRLISEPILHLVETARNVARHKDYSLRARSFHPDEIGVLIDGFNEMLAQIQERDANLEKRVAERTQQLEETHKQLVVTSRQAGMAEVATSVLHNVGNVLNSVNVTASMLLDQNKRSKASQLEKVSALLEENSADLGTFLANDPRGKQIPGYIKQLGQHLLTERQNAMKELETLRKNIEHIKDIVAMQQNYAKVSGVSETVKITDLVEDALHMNAGALSRHDVRVIREYKCAPEITVEKHKVLQILVNLIRNAKYACDESNRPEKQMTLRVSNGDDKVRIAVIDNGIGIPPENMVRIFNHGFTTRKTGHGFGLHSGALAAREMGGDLTADSQGVGMGATFTLELPLPASGRRQVASESLELA